MSGGYRSDPYAQSTYDDPYRAQEAADPYARRSSGSHADPYASHAPYSKRGREYDDYGYDGKRTRYDNDVVARGGGASADPYARSAHADPYARSAPPDPYADRYSSRRDDYRAPDPYASSSHRAYDDRRADDRYASHASHASHYADPYARGSDYGAQRDDRRGSYGGEEYRRRDDYRRDDRGYDRGGYGGGYSDRDYGRSYDRRGGGGGGSSAGYDRRDSYGGGGRDVGYGSSRNYDSGGGSYDRGSGGDRGGGYGRGGGYDDRGGPRGRGRGRGRGGRGRGRGRGGRGGGRGAEREKDPDYVADWADHNAELDERNFKEPVQDSRQGGPEFDITKAVSLFEAPTEVLPSTVPACDDVSNDVDEESCSLLVGGYPASADVDKVRDFFASVAALRSSPEVKDDGNILVVFKRLRDVPFTVEWFKNPSAAKIDSHSVAIKPLKPSADAAA